MRTVPLSHAAPAPRPRVARRHLVRICSGAVFAAHLALPGALAMPQPSTMPAEPSARAASSLPWPEVTLPPDAVSYPLGGQLTVDGLPMRVRGFRQPGSLADTAAWFRRTLPPPLMENRVGDTLVLGRASGPHYITVRLAPSGGATEGVVAVSDVGAALAGRAASRLAVSRLVARLPAGSQVLTSFTSADPGRSAMFLSVANSAGEGANTERLRELLRAEGLEFEREARAADAGPRALAALPAGAAGGRTLFYHGRGREAVAVISRMPDGRASVVLNIVTSMESFK